MNARLETRFRSLLLLLPPVIASLIAVSSARGADSTTSPAYFDKTIHPLLQEYCLKCHSAEKHKGDLDMERFTSLSEVMKHPRVWQGVIEQIGLGEMPPKEKPQPPAADRDRLVAWVGDVLDKVAQERAGDPGPVALRHLSNAEYTYTIRDLTGVSTLDPVREFPADSASGEGFMNVGNSLVMSPTMLTKYLDAAKEIANHAVLLPDGIGFSPSTSQRDWAEERLASIRGFYGRFSEPGGGSAVNLQGIKFDTKDGGVIPLVKYLRVTLAEREGLRSGKKSVADVARAQGVNARYLGLLWKTLNDTQPSLVLDPIRAQWRGATPAQAEAVARSIAEWQAALWRFTQVGHIGKRDGPKAWQVPVVPLAAAREVRMKIPAPGDGGESVLFLAVSDAGDGNQHDFALWENPRLVAPGRPDLPLRDVRAAVAALRQHREKAFSGAAECLAAASEALGSPDKPAVAALAARHHVEPAVLSAWLECLGIGTGEARIDSPITGKMESAQSYDFIKGWTGADALSVLANSSDQHVRVPGNMKPHGVAVHPAPTRRVVVGWRSPVAATLRVDGLLQHAHPECGNGVTWAVELRRGSSRQRLASGTAQGAKEVRFGPFEGLAVLPGDVLSVLVGPRDGNHSCDLTAVDFNLSDGTRTWSLAKDVSGNILAGNPHADGLGNLGVWNFYSEPDNGGGPESVLPPGSVLARWQSSATPEERRRLARELQALLTAPPATLAKDSPDAALLRLLNSVNGPLLAGIVRHAPGGAPQPGPGPGLDPGLFGKHPNGSPVAPTSLCVQAPSAIEVRLPAELAEGCEFVATATLHRETGAEGSVQMQALATRPAAGARLAAGGVREQGSKSTWSDGERPVVTDSPILVVEGSAAAGRIRSALDEFRQLFPAALCYTKIVPVDEVVTLTLYYREDDALRRLMLDDAQAAELDRLWSELHYVSHDPLKLVDAFEQLWQYATQDADPSAFEPMREPIKRRAEEFRKLQLDTQPAHLDALLRFADGAYRRGLSEPEKQELRGLYARLRAEEIPHDQAVRLTLARVLVAPAFLYRAEKPGPGEKPGPVSDSELATRLSYFLWSSAPDAELRALAAAGKLHDPKVLVAQSRRMLRDPKVRRLATEFACAWLHVYDFENLSEKSERHFPAFNGLRASMYEETIRFFTDLCQRDGSTLGLLDADYTFLNEGLARHYGIPGVNGPEWRRVDGIRQYGRGGILGQATILAKESGASRTSPILRGNWLCEVLLGEKLPKPPKDVPRLPEDEATGTLTVRQLTEKHSTDPKCFGCHRRIDPYGYALEAFDAIGRRREADLAGHPLDTRVRLFDGTEIEGADGLRQYLLTKRRDAFLKQFCRKLLGYSLGRAVQLSDGPLISEMRSQLKSHEFRIGAAVEAVVRSRQFREIRGQQTAFED
ncbi:MAG TPA: hypothetical protein DCM86_14960 [Verrucomicrobiales bacterium]|nr:hypothetical protein [Verrucomicrobiales bacterium]